VGGCGVIRITIDSDKHGEGVSTIARYLENHVREIFDNVKFVDADVPGEMDPEIYRNNIEVLIERNPNIEIIAHPRRAPNPSVEKTSKNGTR
jgi:Mrp family chromosome partitioning ATPase